MPSFDHESLVFLFRSQPELAVQLLREVMHVEVPGYTQARLDPADFSQPVPAGFFADAVVLLVDDKPVLTIVIEVQLDRDPNKRFSWPVYMASGRARNRCPVELLVIVPDASLAGWAASPIALDLDEASVVRPRVLGPALVPVVTDVEAARRAPELAVLSAVAHGADEPEIAGRVGVAAMIASLGLDPERAAHYSLMVDAALSSAARAALEKLMQTQGYPIKSEFARVQRASATAAAILRVLAKRALSVSDEQRARILACEDLETLDRWLDTAVVAASTDELFAE